MHLLSDNGGHSLSTLCKCPLTSFASWSFHLKEEPACVHLNPTQHAPALQSSQLGWLGTIRIIFLFFPECWLWMTWGSWIMGIIPKLQLQLRTMPKCWSETVKMIEYKCSLCLYTTNTQTEVWKYKNKDLTVCFLSFYRDVDSNSFRI